MVVSKGLFGIYKITSIINGKIYVGSAICLNRRKITHFYHLRKNKHCNIKLQRSFNKYGEGNFVFEILEIVPNKSNLILREQFYLDLLKPYYNICKAAGSSLGRKLTKEAILKAKTTRIANGSNVCLPETRKKISDKQKGIPKSEDKRLQISISLKKYFEINDSSFKNKIHSGKSKIQLSNSLIDYYRRNVSHNKNRRHTPEHIKKNSESKKKHWAENPHPMLGKKYSEERKQKQRKPIIQYNIATNEIIKEWDSIKEARDSFNGSYSITSCLSKRTNSAHGFKWVYKNN